jgi:peptidoglycan/xylan/chitin deacetylase (PgdA/CDA1 family)
MSPKNEFCAKGTVLKLTKYLPPVTLLTLALCPVFGAQPDQYAPMQEACEVGLIQRQFDIKPYFETYRQAIEITFADAESAQKAEIVVLPLYKGKKWAVSCRWDDNTPSNIRMAGLMDKHGIKGTFYMNGREQGYWGERYDYAGELDDIAGLLVASGNHTLGGHGDRHPSLGYLNRNRLWQEVMRVRIDREAQTDKPICSYAFSNMNWSNDIEGLEVTLDIAEALFRAGYYHNANSTYLKRSGVDMPAANLLPWDKATANQIEAKIAEFTADESLAEKNPNFTFSMHAAAISPESQWEKYDRLFEKYKGREDWWYCNQSEYGAYRLQYALSEFEKKLEGSKVSWQIKRPALLDLNDRIPMSLEVRGPAKESIAKVEVYGGRVEEFDGGQSYRFNLYHTDKLPQRIGWIANNDNHQKLADVDGDKEFDGVMGLLCLVGTKLKLQLANNGKEELRDVRITYRLPLAWDRGVQMRRIARIGAGTAYNDDVVLERAKGGFNYDVGIAFYAVQVDFIRGDNTGRLYLTTSVRSDARDASYPVGRFAFLGPIPDEKFSMEMADAAAKGQLKSLAVEGKDKVLEWESTEDYVDFLHVNALVAEKPAAEHNLQGKYLLETVVESAARQEVKTVVPARTLGIAAIYVNSERVHGDRFALGQGANNLLLVFGAPGRRAPMFGLASAQTGMTLQNVKYRLPNVSD